VVPIQKQVPGGEMEMFRDLEDTALYIPALSIASPVHGPSGVESR